jgi:hypothetical protein
VKALKNAKVVPATVGETPVIAVGKRCDTGGR